LIYRSAVSAVQALAAREKKKLWPSIEFKDEELETVGKALHAIVPSLRDEAFLPDVEYQVEYSVPILPEPLAFVQLRRQEERADPVLTMGYALVMMAVVLGVLLYVLLYPPWVPSK
jgi:hypothetical protein